MRIIDMIRGDPREIRHLVYDLVVPRPVAWVSTRSAEGVDNLAPFSFYNAVSSSPPIVMICCTRPHDTRERSGKDTARNILETEEFVLHPVSVQDLPKVIITSEVVPPEIDEFETAGLAKAPSVSIAPPRIVQAKAAFECRLHFAHEIGDSLVVYGRIITAHVDETLFDGGRVLTDRLDPLTRISVGSYAKATPIA